MAASSNVCPLQSAYRGAQSTEAALVKIVDDIHGAIDSGSVVALVGLDTSAAFDTVSHHALLSRLEHEFGVTAAPLNWIDSHLSDRTVSMSIANKLQLLFQ